MEIAPTCPLCASTHRQIKYGKTRYGSQKYQCHDCQKTYNPVPRKQGYPTELRRKAVQMCVDGTSFRRIARFLEVNHQTVVNWINAHHAALPPPPDVSRNTAEVIEPDVSRNTAEVIEMDELFTFIGTKKAPPTS